MSPKNYVSFLDRKAVRHFVKTTDPLYLAVWDESHTEGSSVVPFTVYGLTVWGMAYEFTNERKRDMIRQALLADTEVTFL
jgi:hypothetical protein